MGMGVKVNGGKCQCGAGILEQPTLLSQPIFSEVFNADADRFIRALGVTF